MKYELRTTSSVRRQSVVRPSSVRRPSVVRPSSVRRPSVIRPGSRLQAWGWVRRPGPGLGLGSLTKPDQYIGILAVYMD